MISTSYFAKLKRLSADTIPIAICAKAPPWYQGIVYKKLAPSYDILMEYKQTLNKERYILRFRNEILAKLDQEMVVQELVQLSCGKNIALICYEKPSDFCHRHLVADWLGQIFFDRIGELQL